MSSFAIRLRTQNSYHTTQVVTGNTVHLDRGHSSSPVELFLLLRFFIPDSMANTWQLLATIFVDLLIGFMKFSSVDSFPSQVCYIFTRRVYYI